MVPSPSDVCIWTIQGWRMEDPAYECPLCSKKQTEDELWEHWNAEHYIDNKTYICPICIKEHDDKKPQGSLSWGYSNHLHHKHGPILNLTKLLALDTVSSKEPTHGFALVICRHPDKKRYLLVEEGCNNGWWLPAGRVDPGETFQKAAIRETLEEGGIMVDLKGILRVEHSPFPSGGGRLRVVFYAEPKDDRPPKSRPNFESVRASWITWDELETALAEKKMHLRGKEPIQWFQYLEKGGTIHSIDLLTREEDPVLIT